MHWNVGVSDEGEWMAEITVYCRGCRQQFEFKSMRISADRQVLQMDLLPVKNAN